ncbi:MAM and LDL-receptor class A domain-containing protein 2 [Ixodes scapularis]
MAHKQSSSHKRARSAFLVAIVLLQCAAYVTSDTCDFENGMCKGYTTSGSGSGVFKVARVKDLNFGPNVDHRPGTGPGRRRETNQVHGKAFARSLCSRVIRVTQSSSTTRAGGTSRTSRSGNARLNSSWQATTAW